MDPTGWTISDFANAYESGTSVADVIDAVLALMRAAPIGVLIGEPLDDLARRDAHRIASLDASTLPLYGVPFVVKDNIDVAGAPTTAGCPGFAYEPVVDATVVELLRAAGAIVVGKANLDQFATGLVGTRSPYGVPPNVIDPSLVPGGSSSGSAVAVALGLVPFSLGTDTAGSGRVPAALNGIVGFKPTLGSASTSGIVPAVRRLDCPSVFARTVDDAAVVARLIRRPDLADAFMRPVMHRVPFRSSPIVGVPSSWPAELEITDDMVSWFAVAVDRLRSLGCEIHPVDITPLLDVGRMLYGSAMVAERSAVVGDAVDKGVAGLDPVVASIISSGNDITAIDAYRAEYELTRRRALAVGLWTEIDVLALPTTVSVASLADVAAQPVGRNEMMGRLTTFVNLLDLMGIVVPLPGVARLPAGLQLIGLAGHDDEVARLALGFESGVFAANAQPCSLVVVGAHLTGLPLNHQLTERRATFVRRARTSADYRLFALPGTVPPKPGLVRVASGAGAEIAVEVWAMGHAEFGSFVDAVPAPLCIGSVTLDDGSVHHGFLCESFAIAEATDITEFGGWKAYIASPATPGSL